MSKLFCLFILGLQALALAENTKEAEATISPTQGNSARGKVLFIQLPEGVRIIADVEGLKPGEYGFHIHEFGNCSAPDGSSAGGHFNPTNEPHSCPDHPKRHIGDLGNLHVDGTGKGHVDEINKAVSLDGSNSIIGKSVLIHSGKDDCTTQPSGRSGSRIGCGIIKAKTP